MDLIQTSTNVLPNRKSQMGVGGAQDSAGEEISQRQAAAIDTEMQISCCTIPGVLS